MIDPAVGRAFLDSATAAPERAVTPDPVAILAARTRAHRFAVETVPLASVERWHLGEDALVHESGRFFSVDGLAIKTNFGPTPRWTQPIIQQPEIGMLGFLAKRIGGTLHLLAQAKMEPGNRAMVQFSPTVQATPSNYTRVHGGRHTPYLHHFLGPSRGRILVDQLQSEQGTRYFQKRNRNMIVEVPEDEDVPVYSEFAWLTLRQLHELLAAGSSVNMNARTVLASIPYHGAVDSPDLTPFRRRVLESSAAGTSDEDLASALTWVADRKSELDLDVRRIRLADLEHWICDEQSIRHETGRFFQIIGLEITAESREVGAWMQPMMQPTRQGYVAFLCQVRDGVLQFLVQARIEPGFIDRLELGATVVASPDVLTDPDLPPFGEYLRCPESRVRIRAPQSEDGGRFFHDDTNHLVIEVPEGEPLELPSNYRWVTLGVLKRIMRRGYVVAIEARSLLACLA